MPVRLPACFTLLAALAVTAQVAPAPSDSTESARDSAAISPRVEVAAPVEMSTVRVRGKSVMVQTKEQPYDVSVADIRALRNTGTTVVEAVTRQAGVRVRETGGKGSAYNVSLNGLSGRSVRFFLDGVPMDRYGPALNLHALPVNLVDRVEIYKGVVPPHFGSDALGGVVNVVTADPEGTFGDASYTVGSFGLRQATGMAGWNPSESPWYARAGATHARADNSYEVSGPGVEVADPQTGRTVPYRGRRFHDGYEAWSLLGETGVRDAGWADRFAVRWIQGEEDKELQHGNTMAHVYGEAMRFGSTRGPSAQYRKAGFLHRDLTLDLYASFTQSATTVVDTSSRKYDWSGAVINEHPLNSELGSGAEGKSMLTIDDEIWLHQGGLAWDFRPGHRLAAHGTLDLTVRRGEDPFGSGRSATFREPQDLRKIVSSLSHRLILGDDRYTQYLWIKNYDLRVSSVFEVHEVRDSGWGQYLDPVRASSNSTGYGYAGAWDVSDGLLVKASLERAYRLPDAHELLGDGVFVRTAATLRPERSWNANVGLMDARIPLGGPHALSFEASGFYRWTEDLILYVVQSNLGAGAHSNVGKVRGVGGTFEAGYRFGGLFDASANATYQDLRDQRRRVGLDRNITYNDRLPNTPYLMANGSAGLSFGDVLRPADRLRLSWTARYVHEFYLSWPSLGSPGTKAVIPAQFINDAGLSWSLAEERLNIGFDVKNLFNEQVYDNYLLQKPGREFALKVRAFFRSPG